MAAVLACGHHAAVSHRDAAALLGLRPDNRARVDVSVPRAVRSKSGIEVHGSDTLLPRDLTVQDGIPCTSVARTLVDLGDVLDRRGVERALEQSEVLRLFDLAVVEETLARAGPRRGAGVLRALLGEVHCRGITDRVLEERFLALCRRAGLPDPEVNVWVPIEGDEFKVDFLWRAERLVVEADSRTFHGTRQAFERDRRRDQVLTVAGFRVLRFTWRQVTGEPERVAATVRAVLGR